MALTEKTKKIFNIILSVFTWIVVAFAVFMVVFTIITVTTVDRNDRSLFGVKLYIVQTDSMSESENNKDMDIHFNAGDIILIKNVEDPKALNEGDVISFISTNQDSYMETITHMIREVKRDSNGKVLGYVTYGTNTGTSDEALVEPEYVLGRYAGKLPGLGNFFAFVKSTPGYIVCILVPFLLLILYNGINAIKTFREYKQEQAAIAEDERAQIAKERQQNEEMLRQLQALQEQLAKQNGGVIPSTATEESPTPSAVASSEESSTPSAVASSEESSTPSAVASSEESSTPSAVEKIEESSTPSAVAKSEESPTPSVIARSDSDEAI